MRLEWWEHDGTVGLRLVGAVVSGLREFDAADVARRLPVYPTELLGSAGASGPVSSGAIPAVGGRYDVDAAGVAFVPRFPFLDRTSYTMLVHRSLTDPSLPTDHFDVEDFESLEIVRPAPVGASSTRVIEIHPTSREIPRNLLKLYLHFSEPMSEGQIEQHVTIRRADTHEPVTHVLLPMEPELWDPSGRRATVLFDPARIKRGLLPHREIGYPLEVGVPIEVVVGEGFRDADGRGLASEFVRRFDVGADLRSLVDPQAWRTRIPEAGTTEPLVVSFDRPLDHALLQHCLEVIGPGGGAPVRGRSDIGEQEREWTFRPAAPWVVGPHRLVVDTVLEDLAGNSVARVFDREIANADHDGWKADRVYVDLPPG